MTEDSGRQRSLRSLQVQTLSGVLSIRLEDHAAHKDYREWVGLVHRDKWGQKANAAPLARAALREHQVKADTLRYCHLSECLPLAIHRWRYR